MCASAHACYTPEQRCDAVEHCVDGSDEWECPPVHRECTPDEYRCVDDTCIPREKLCDREYDCVDAADETNCGECV
jgi:hypothetical protein